MQEESSLIPDVERVTDLIDAASVIEAENLRHARIEHDRRMVRDQNPKDEATLNAMADEQGITEPVDREDFKFLHRWATTECDECGSDIGEGRLNAAIRNRLCIHCANVEERSKRR